MDVAKFSFLKNDFIPLLASVDGGTKGSWGKMNAQQMVEHVTAFFKISSGKIKFPIVTPEEHLPKYKAFVLSDKEFRENTRAPAAVLGDEPLPLRNATMEEALAGLEKSIREFIDYFKNEESKLVAHPVFGELNFEEWVLLHYKHVLHHAKQFGLIKQS
jgi:Protein of unknown function (DUF1569)